MPTRIASTAALVAAALALWAPAAGAAGLPEVNDTWATGVSATTVDLHAMVNPNGLAATARIEYITATARQENLTATPPRDPFTGAVKSPPGGFALGSGATAVELSRHIAGLKANTAYRYRATASNSEGTVLGPTRAFASEENAPSFSLPDARGWELVSPIDKNGGEIQGPGGNFNGGVLQASADGSAVTYSSASSFGGGQGAPGASQYLSRRDGGGWGTENITVPTAAGAYGPEPDGVPYQLFSGDLGRGLVFTPQRCALAPCVRSYGLRQSLGGALSGSPAAADLAFAGSSPDLSQVVLSTCAALSANATEAAGVGGACDPGKPNLYRWSGGALTLINILPGEALGTPGATLAAQSGAVSADGSRAYFNEEGKLYLRRGTQTLQVDESVGGGATLQTTILDGSIAFFSKEGHLYRYLAASGVATDLTPTGGVQGVLGVSPDGSYLYYLTALGLFLDHGGAIGKVADAADATNYPPATATARVAANGNLAFLSSTALTEADNAGFSEVYLYSPATATLSCVSCNPTGARPIGPSSIPGATANGKASTATHAYKPRALSASGNRLFFDSQDALVAQDSNDDRDVYQWEAQGVGSCQAPGGCIALISSGRASEGASFLDASADGSDVFFTTDGSLVPTDPGVVDVYDAKVGGGFPTAPTPLACLADACQVVPEEPEDPTPGTAFFHPEGNPPVSFPKAGKKQHHAKDHRKKNKKPKHHRVKAKRGGRR